LEWRRIGDLIYQMRPFGHNLPQSSEVRYQFRFHFTERL
jgi:hypothetical protein